MTLSGISQDEIKSQELRLNERKHSNLCHTKEQNWLWIIFLYVGTIFLWLFKFSLPSVKSWFPFNNMILRNWILYKGSRVSLSLDILSWLWLCFWEDYFSQRQNKRWGGGGHSFPKGKTLTASCTGSGKSFTLLGHPFALIFKLTSSHIALYPFPKP